MKNESIHMEKFGTIIEKFSAEELNGIIEILNHSIFDKDLPEHIKLKCDDVSSGVVDDISISGIIEMIDTYIESAQDAEQPYNEVIYPAEQLSMKLMILCNYPSLNDDLNPTYLFQSVPSVILKMIASGEIDAKQIARDELKNRYVD